MKIDNKTRRIIIVVAAVILCTITFTPLILSEGRIEPKFLSMPYTLWTSMIVTIILVLLTYLASRFRDDL